MILKVIFVNGGLVVNHWVCQVIRLYQRWLSPVLPPLCRFYPSCSRYALGSFERYPFFKASWLVVGRLCRCHPLHPGGFDPVPDWREPSAFSAKGGSAFGGSTQHSASSN